MQAAANAAAAAGVFAPAPPLNFHVHVPAAQPAGMAAAQLAHQNRQNRRQNEANEYCALFVALIGEGKEPQGVINTSDGKVVRAFHRFTLVDQKSGRDIMKGRQRHDGAVKISCARQDPNARNCHGYRKFVKKAVLEDPARGFLLEDRIVIKYTIELVVSQARLLSAIPRLLCCMCLCCWGDGASCWHRCLVRYGCVCFTCLRCTHPYTPTHGCAHRPQLVRRLRAYSRAIHHQARRSRLWPSR